MITTHNNRYDSLDKQLEAVLESFQISATVKCGEVIEDGIAKIKVTATTKDERAFDYDITIPTDADKDLADDIVEGLIKQLVADVITHSIRQTPSIATAIVNPSDSIKIKQPETIII